MENTVARWKPCGFVVSSSKAINGMKMQEAPILNRCSTLWNVQCAVIEGLDHMTPKQLLAEIDEVFESALDCANMISLTMLDDVAFENDLAALRDHGYAPPGPLLEAVLIAWSFGLSLELGIDDDDDDGTETHPDDLVTKRIMVRAASAAYVLCQAVFTCRTGAIREALRVFVFNARASHSRCNQVTKSLNASLDACLDKMSEAVSALRLLETNTELSQ